MTISRADFDALRRGDTLVDESARVWLVLRSSYRSIMATHCRVRSPEGAETILRWSPILDLIVDLKIRPITCLNHSDAQTEYR